jgi:hypothetical protein
VATASEPQSKVASAEPHAAATSEPESQDEPAAGTSAQPRARAVPVPFAELEVVTPRSALPPLKSVRSRDLQEQEDRSRSGRIRVRVGTKPRGCAVLYGGKLLGRTPFTLKAPRGSTPLDVAIKCPGYMTLRTRIRRLEDRNYYYRMTPAKIR